MRKWYSISMSQGRQKGTSVCATAAAALPGARKVFIAEVLVGLATDTTVYSSRRGQALKVNTLTFSTRTSKSSWHPGLPGRPLIPRLRQR